MAVLKKFRSRFWSSSDDAVSTNDGEEMSRGSQACTMSPLAQFKTNYDVRPLTVAQLDECWQLDQLCFVDGEAYSRDTFEYLLTLPDSVSYRVVTSSGAMVGFIVGIIEPDKTGHITTIGVSPAHRRRRLAHRLMIKAEEGFRRRKIALMRLEVRSINTSAQALYRTLGFQVTQRLPRYYSNGGDGLLMVKSLD